MWQTIKTAAKPTGIELLIIFLISGGLVLFTHYSLIEDRFLQSASVANEDWHATFIRLADKLNGATAMHYVSLGLFWACIGLLAYVGLWVISNVAIALWNGIVYEGFYVHKVPVLIRARHITWVSLVVALLLALFLISIQYGIPSTLILFTRVFANSAALTRVGYGLLSVCALSLNLFLLFTLFKITWQLAKLAASTS